LYKVGTKIGTHTSKTHRLQHAFTIAQFQSMARLLVGCEYGDAGGCDDEGHNGDDADNGKYDGHFYFSFCYFHSEGGYTENTISIEV
jgi:hypothetical protein